MLAAPLLSYDKEKCLQTLPNDFLEMEVGGQNGPQLRSTALDLLFPPPSITGQAYLSNAAPSYAPPPTFINIYRNNLTAT